MISAPVATARPNDGNRSLTARSSGCSARPVEEEIPGQRQRCRGGKKYQAGEFRDDRQAGGGAEQQAMLPCGALRPAERRDVRRPQESGERHIGSGQAGVRQDGRKKAEKKQRDRRHCRAVVALAPHVDHQAGHPEEWQDSQPRQGEREIVVVVAAENARAFDRFRFQPRSRRPLRPDSQQVRPQRRRHARQRRMLRFVKVDVLVQPLHAAGDMGRLVGGVVEDRVGGGDADRRKQHQQHCQDAAPPFDKRQEGRNGRGGLGTAAPFLLSGGHQFILEPGGLTRTDCHAEPAPRPRISNAPAACRKYSECGRRRY